MAMQIFEKPYHILGAVSTGLTYTENHPMNRREFLPASATLAGVVVAGRAFTQDVKCVAPCTPPRPITLRQDALTLSLQSSIGSKLALVKEHHSLHALTVPQWKAVTTHHASWGDEHGRLGNLHTVDLYVQSHQVVLRERFGAKPIDRFLTLGSHRVWTENVSGLGELVYALGTAGVQTPGASVNVPDFRMGPEQCAALDTYIIDAGILAALFGLAGQEYGAAVFGALALTFGLVRFAFCR